MHLTPETDSEDANLTDEEVLKRLHDTALQIEAWRNAKNLTKAALIRRFPILLGSEKTYSKLLAGDARELNAAEWLESYTTALEKIRQDADSAGDEILWDDLAGIRAARRVAAHLLTTGGNDRYALVTGETGMGKTSLLTILKRKHAEKLVIMQAVSGLTESAFAFLGQLLLALDDDYTPAAVQKLPGTYPLRLATVQERLRAKRIIIAIEEGQDLGEAALKAIKTLINTTKAAFMVMAIPTLWRKLERANYEEAAQLTGNRNGGVIKLTLDAADIEKAVNRRCREHAMDGKDLRRAVQRLSEACEKRGWMKFIARALSRAVAHSGGQAVTLEHIEAGIAEERTSRAAA